MKPCIEKIETAIQRAQHPPAPAPDLYKATSVMALFLFNRTPELLFIQKADKEGYPWRNQMAFPGGHVDKKDANACAAALRELNEETGIQNSNVTVIGSLGHFQTINHRDIHAFAGIWNQKDTLVCDPREIRRVFRIPLPHLEKQHVQSGYAGRRPSIMELTYPFKDVVIWGVTAKIVHHMIEILRNMD